MFYAGFFKGGGRGVNHRVETAVSINSRLASVGSALVVHRR